MNRAARLRDWQGLTVGLMVLGYAGYYLCRSNLSVSLLAIAEELTARGLAPNVSEAKERLGWAVSLGTVGYAVGKFAAGSLVDLLGGRRNYLIGMAGAVVCTMLFALGGSIPIFTLVWFANRLIQSLGWPGMIKITSRWFSYASYGTVMGVISLSFLFGDALARTFMGFLIDAGLSWRGVFWIAAGVLGALWVLNFALIRESPKELDLPEPETNPANLFGALGEDPHPEAAGPLWATLARSPAFWFVCLISLGVTLLRETFNNWTPTYLVEGIGVSKGNAATMSSLFPFFGGVSVLVAGMLGDRFGRGVRAAIILGGMMLCGLALALLGSADFAGRAWEALFLVSTVAFLLIGPYSYLAGAISLDFGGKRGGATACGIIDGVGYLFGGVVAGKVIANLSVTLGWQGVFKVLAVVALLTSVAAAFFLVDQVRPASKMAGTPLKVVDAEVE
ncbi:MAG TPA: MFS transporter [Isosphaeraceae bacterium]|nr:MFS transporter [Isosphaeraceae bacterium]